MKATEIKAIIFDLGGVILDIDYNRTVSAFKALQFKDFDRHYSQMKQSGVFDQLERGEIGEGEFVAIMKETISHASHEEIVAAWNAIILDFPEGRLEYLKRVGKALPIYLLSNTNEIHLARFDEMLYDSTKTHIKDYFKKAYLSHEIGHRKPEPEAWSVILNEQGLESNDVLFIDDSPQHIEAAGLLGFQTIHLTLISDLEKELNPFLAQLN
tara:strand:+ start:144 stop:779 length:636 start_codon:yes stop_codon:yes gene_type:complete